jgi:hypothetical protein
MGSFILKPVPARDRYLVWSTSVDGPTVIGTRVDVIRWLVPPVGSDTPEQAERIMKLVDKTGTSEFTGQYGWHDPGPLNVGELSPDDGWYWIYRWDLDRFVDAIGAEDTPAIHALLVRYA